MDMALEGIRVVDWTQWHAGPYATCLLADLGAEVIHVENPGRPDGWRGTTTLFGVSQELPGGRNLQIEEQNRNKKGMTINLKKPSGKEILFRLVEKSDVFVTNFRAKGFGYDVLSRYNPKLIYALITGFGTQGPDKDLPAGEIIAYARGGGMLMQSPEGAPPDYSAMGLGDRAAGLYLSHAILAALLARERLGIGQQLTVALLSGVMNIFGQSVICPLVTGREYEPLVREKVRNPLYNFYQCKDGRWIVLALFQRPWTWPAFCRAIGMPELEKNPRFDSLEKREENNEELISLLDRVFATKTYEEWDRFFREEEGLVFSRVNRMSDLASDPQVVANDYITQWDHPVIGPMKFLGFPVQYSKTPCSFRTAAPEVGQHTEEILIDLLGYSWEEIARLREEEAI